MRTGVRSCCLDALALFCSTYCLIFECGYSSPVLPLSELFGGDCGPSFVLPPLPPLQSLLQNHKVTLTFVVVDLRCVYEKIFSERIEAAGAVIQGETTDQEP